jgi:hypothetical protein
MTLKLNAATTEPDQVDLIDAYRLFCRTTGKNALADARFIGQLRKALPHLHQQRRQLARPIARERGIDEDNRWLPARFFGFTIDEEIWRRDTTDVIPLVRNPHFPEDIRWDETLAAWEEQGLAFQWNNHSKRAVTGFIWRNGVQSTEGRLLELRRHRPDAPDD